MQEEFIELLELSHCYLRDSSRDWISIQIQIPQHRRITILCWDCTGEGTVLHIDQSDGRDVKERSRDPTFYENIV